MDPLSEPKSQDTNNNDSKPEAIAFIRQFEIDHATLYSVGQITSIFMIVKCIQYLLIIATPNTFFDNSTELLLDEYTSQKLLNKFFNVNLFNKLLPWDSVFFIKGMMGKENSQRYENEFAFSSLWIKLVRFVYQYFNPVEPVELYSILKTAIVLENFLHYLSILVLYQLTFKLFSPTNKGYNTFAAVLARKTAILFIFTSAAGFITGIYSEPLSFFLTFTGMLAREYCMGDSQFSRSFDNNWVCFPLYSIISTACFTLATINRSNCILLGVFYLYDLFQLIKRKNYRKAIVYPLLSGFVMLCCIIIQQYYIPYKYFCPQRGEWCNTSISNNIVPFITRTSFYSFIQSHYWNIGFMKYWTLNNIPNFIFAFPNLFIMSYASFYYSWIYPSYNLRPMIIITNLFLILMIFIAHIQIINRVSSFIPLHLWYISDRLIKNSTNKSGIKSNCDDMLVKCYIYWLVFWIPLQTVLFANFLPPA